MVSPRLVRTSRINVPIFNNPADQALRSLVVNRHEVALRTDFYLFVHDGHIVREGQYTQSRTSMLHKNSNNFKIELLHLGLSQSEVARQLAISRQYVSDIVHGRKTPRLIIGRMVEEIGLPEYLFPKKAA